MVNRTVAGHLLGCLVFILFCQRTGRPENHSATPAALGACDSPYPDAQGNVSFSCRGLTDEQLRLLPSLSLLINKLLASGVGSSRLESQTDGIVKMLQTSPEAKGETAPIAKPPPAITSPVPAPNKEVISYDYRGYKTSSLTGPRLLAGDAGESKLYQTLLELQKAGKWKKLLKDSIREIKKVPDWLTPYAFKAVALQHLGNTKEAIATLEYVDQRSKGNSDYDQVRRLLNHLRPAKS